ncbi:DMT family transporter [Candidatus Avelusimicrobium faecicola]|uniref:DMT family transporter n=1 Tax=Candidatus Avelusimicrobium faecicola TaxID=3416205 RepID=UPI002A7D9AFE|nr:DMT family transporter [Spirochaetota bacterium]MCI7536430.1 DMT family transporter [Spirochaetota bacterium]MDY2940080.1 DMT family transporter [Elusimicrobiaceae bacterium]
MFNVAPVVAIWLAWFFVAANVVGTKFATPYAASTLFMLLSCTVAAVCFIPYLVKTGGWKTLLAKKVWPQCLLMATFGTALPMTFFMLALNYTTPANAAILNQFEMVYSLILAYFLLGEKPTGKQIGGSLLIVLGVGVLLWQTGISVQLKGDLLILGTLWMFQVSHIFAKKLPQDMPPALIAAARAIFAIPVLAVFCAVLFTVQGPLLFTPTWVLWVTLGFSAICNYFIGNTFWYTAIRNMDLGKATAIILSYPVMTFILSVLLGQDTVNTYKVLGLILALSGAYIVTGIIKGDKK